MQRRDFLARQLRVAAAAGAATWSVPFARAGVAGTPRPELVPGRFVDVDHHELVHALRDGRQPLPAEPTERCDVAIIGGGMAGLVAAHRLSNHRVVVLEKEAEPGGNSRSREIAGCRHALGAFLSQGAVPPFVDFFRELPAPFIALAGSDHALCQEGRTVRDPLGTGLSALPWPAEDRAALQRALERLAPLADPVTGLAFPMDSGTPAQRALDRRTQWAQYDDERLPPNVRALFDALLAARIADSGEQLSAWYGSYLLANLLNPAYTMRGGHGAYSELLASRLQAAQPGALRTGYTVLRVEPRGPQGQEAGVLVTGVDARGRPSAIEARCAVIATPKHLAKHLVPGLAQQRGAALGAFRYNAYLVAQVLLRRRVEAAYETVAPTARHARFIVAPDALPGNRRTDGGGLLTVYTPYPRVPGRVALLQADAQALAAQTAAELRTLMPETEGAIEEIVLHRWGHPMLTAAPGMGGALSTATEPTGPIVYAHSDNVGLTGLYSAIWAGMSAQTDAELILN